VIPNVASCTDTPLTDKNLTRLPRNKAEGDIPQIALATGGADPLECLPRKIGIDDSEFTPAGGTGRVHLYAGYGYDTAPTTNGAKKFAPTLNGGAAFTDAQAFWSDLGNLKKYDIVLLACEGQTNPQTKPDAARKALYDYASAGGRVFASHWHRYWFDDADAPSPFPSVGTWTDRNDPTGGPPASIDGTVDVSFPKGVALRDWLVNVKASTTPGKLPIVESKHNLDAVDPAKAQQWITLVNPKAANKTAVEYATFNAPVGVPPADQCGRVVYSDLHVSSGDTIGQPFPSGCTTTDLSPQEKALEFMLFDLSSCIQKDDKPPVPPK
jgi:hypothetical protein